MYVQCSYCGELARGAVDAHQGKALADGHSSRPRRDRAGSRRYASPRQQAPEVPMEEGRSAQSKAAELRAFLALSVVMAPVLAVIIVSGYGFLVWMVQLVAGPPGH
jgi:nitrate reductase NapE